MQFEMAMENEENCPDNRKKSRVGSREGRCVGSGPRSGSKSCYDRRNARQHCGEKHKD